MSDNTASRKTSDDHSHPRLLRDDALISLVSSWYLFAETLFGALDSAMSTRRYGGFTTDRVMVEFDAEAWANLYDTWRGGLTKPLRHPAAELAELTNFDSPDANPE